VLFLQPEPVVVMNPQAFTRQELILPESTVAATVLISLTPVDGAQKLTLREQVMLGCIHPSEFMTMSCIKQTREVLIYLRIRHTYSL
jgi:hypothetical protein